MPPTRVSGTRATFPASGGCSEDVKRLEICESLIASLPPSPMILCDLEIFSVEKNHSQNDSWLCKDPGDASVIGTNRLLDQSGTFSTFRVRLISKGEGNPRPFLGAHLQLRFSILVT